jgi:hypothetical protein
MKGALEYGLLIYSIYHCILQLATYPLASSSDVGLFARPWQDRKIEYEIHFENGWHLGKCTEKATSITEYLGGDW